MLPAPSRIRRSREFTETMSHGVRAGRASLVVHLDVPADPSQPAAGHAARAGFVVSKAVGNAVARHLVARRLRALVAVRLDGLPDGSRLVVRALPGSATASSGQLARDLDSSLQKAVARALERSTAHRERGSGPNEAGSMDEGRVR
ncbi:MAG TPA: ribonuclease P protein component [Candidatus Nanopelagicales bacterium]|jgi:ribonuclease P protein component